MLTNLFLRLGWSRDDQRWLWMRVLAVAGLVASGVIDVPYWAGELGIPLSVTGVRWVQALAVAALWLSGQYGNSPLPGRKLSGLLLAVGLSLSLSGCATLATPVGRGSETASSRLAELAQVVDHGARVIAVAEQVQTLEVALYRQGRLKDDTHQAIQRAFLVFARQARASLRAAEQVATPTADRVTALRALAVYGDGLLDAIAPQIPDHVAELRTALSVIRAALTAFP